MLLGHGWHIVRWGSVLLDWDGGGASVDGRRHSPRSDGRCSPMEGSLSARGVLLMWPCVTNTLDASLA
jgi:hypothetical protein